MRQSAWVQVSALRVDTDLENLQLSRCSED
jgi:hypothetical protein